MTKKIAFVFPGQGSQIVGMGRDLYDNFASAKEVFQQVDEILGNKLSQIIFDGPSEELTKTENAQSALMAVSMAVVAVLEKDFGKKIDEIAAFVAGHSLGEYSALCAAKALTLAETTKLLKVRGNAMAKCGSKTAGAMAAIIGAEIDLVEKVVAEASNTGEICQIANDNSVGQIVISGSKKGVDTAIEIAKKNGIKRAIPLPVSGAFHSALMQDAAEEMAKALQNAQVAEPRVALVANVTAAIVRDPIEIRNLLTKQITGSVRWRETMLFMEKNGVSEIIELGAGKVLANLVGRTCPNIQAKSVQNIVDIKTFAENY